MGKPGGFFKKLKAKQKKKTAKTRRGTKGASKEERRLKYNDRVALYAAKRQAEELAAVSSSSEDEPVTDSEEEENREYAKLQKLRSLLGVEVAASKDSKKKNGSAKGHENLKRKKNDTEEDSDNFSAYSDEGDEEEDEEEEQSKQKVIETEEPSSESASESESLSGDSEVKSEKDWKYYLGKEEGNDEEDDEEDEDGLMMDLGSDDDEEDEEDEEVENPLFELEKEGHVDPLDNPSINIEEMGSEEEEDEDEEEEDEDEEEEEEREEEFVDIEEAIDGEEIDDHTPKKLSKREQHLQQLKEKAELEERKSVLPQFTLGTSSLATIQNSLSIPENDPWLMKYHLDIGSEVDKSSLQTIALSSEARQGLAHSNDALKQRSTEIEQNTTKQERGVFHVSADGYDCIHPDQVTIALSEHAKKGLLHPPFDLRSSSSPSSSSSGTAATHGNNGRDAKKRLREEDKPSMLAAETAEMCPSFIHPTLWTKWVEFRKKYNKPIFTIEERGLLDLLQGYPDLMDCMRCWQNGASRREIFVLHLLNHWFKAQAVVVAHDEIIKTHRNHKKELREKKKAAKKKKKNHNNEEDKGNDSNTTDSATEALLAEEDIFESENYELRDRGFSKTRLFVMLPMRNIALHYVKTIIEVLGADPLQCSKLELLVGDFSEVEENADPTFKRRPLDYRRQFEGNIDDSFCVGLHLKPDKVSVYAHPLNSDIIICSPLGLRRRVEKNGDVLVSLSSVEVCLIDEAHVLLMQNWDHVAAVLEMLNKRPTETTHGLSDLRRVYAWALNGKSGRHRQSIISSNISHATLLGAFRNFVNSSGKVLLQRTEQEGAVAKVVSAVRQHFLRFDTTALDTVDDERFRFFTEQIFPSRINTLAERDVRIIIFVPSYFDFVRLRNYLYREYRETFAAISEYSTLSQQRQALGQFSDLERPILLVTERFYFFKRYFVKMAEVLVFYSPPLFAEFYNDLVNRLVITSPNVFALTVYCKYDTHELSRLVGTRRTRQLLERESGVFSFVTS